MTTTVPIAPRRAALLLLLSLVAAATGASLQLLHAIGVLLFRGVHVLCENTGPGALESNVTAPLALTMSTLEELDANVRPLKVTRPVSPPFSMKAHELGVPGAPYVNTNCFPVIIGASPPLGCHDTFVCLCTCSACAECREHTHRIETST